MAYTLALLCVVDEGPAELMLQAQLCGKVG